MKWIEAPSAADRSRIYRQANGHRSTMLATAWLCWLGLLPWLHAQDAAETRAFRQAVQAFQTGIFDRAARELGEFVIRYPTSSYVPDAVLLQGRAALHLKNFQTAIDLLSTNAPRAGRLADEYRYLLGDAHFQRGDFRGAADTFASLTRDFTNSARLLEASYGEALARFKLKEWRRVAELLEDPNGTFQRVAALRANDELAVSGRLLLGETLFEGGEFGRAEAAVRALPEADLIPEFKWRRQYLLCRIQLADQRPQEALAGTTNLLELARATGQQHFEAESVAMHGDVLRRAGQFEAAAQVYEKNLGDTVSLDRRRRALLNIIQLALVQDKIEEAEQRLRAFLARHPEDSASDVVLLTLGEMLLKHHLLSQTNVTNNTSTAIAAVTNHLQQALTQFESLLKNHTNSSLRGQAQLDRGWCLWLEERITDSQAAFKNAAELLPHSEEQAMARFKLADTQFQLRDFTNAVHNYHALLDDFRAVPKVRDILFDRVLYQTVRACLELNDSAGAEEAMRRLLQEFPGSSFADRSMLLVGQKFTQIDDSSKARDVFTEFTNRFAQSTLLPEVELAIARTYVLGDDWVLALKHYEAWLARFGTNALRPRAEYYRAWAYAKAGQEHQALNLFTNFVAQYQTNELAPEAQNWVGYYYFRQRDFINAQKSFQTIIENTNWSATPLTYQARLMAGRSAYARQGWNDAKGHFTALINDGPPELVPEALFALGDTMTREDPDRANPLKKFDDAKTAFKKIPDRYPTNDLVPRAWGRIGDCYLQLAGSDARFYSDAANSYTNAMIDADVPTRSLAQCALGQVLEHQAKRVPDSTNLLKMAFEHYYDVFSKKNLRDGEVADPLWLKEAGLNAARLAEDRGEWEVAVNIYKALATELPPLRPSLDRKLRRAAEQIRTDKE